jgi:CRP-like cAMP-binding protein
LPGFSGGQGSVQTMVTPSLGWVTAAKSTLRASSSHIGMDLDAQPSSNAPLPGMAFFLQQIRNTEEIFEINRIRSAERRLLMLLRWLGVRFGQDSSRGYRLSLKDMNLTHRSLAEICGLTRGSLFQGRP